MVVPETTMATLSLSDPVVQTYIVYSAILALKLLSLSTLTAIFRMAKGVVANPEDTLMGAKVRFNDPDVERVRRAHLNDLENIPVFWFLGALYLTTGPAAFVATNLFRVYTLCRIMYSIVFAVIPLPPPSRGITFGIPYIITWYMGIHVAFYYVSA